MNEPDNGIFPRDEEDKDDSEFPEVSPQPEPPTSQPEPLTPPADLVDSTKPQENPFKPAYQRMLNEIRVWGWSSSLLGVAHFAISGILNPAWGISLFAVGGISFLIKEASMFIVYAVIMGWVGVSNVLSGSIGGWTLFGVLQAYWSYQLYRKYQVYRMTERKYLEYESELEEPANRAEDSFPGCGCAMGLVGLLGAVGIFFTMIIAITAQGSDAPMPENFQVIEFILGVLLASGILGFALSVAALVAGYKRKWLAWGGVVAGGLLMAFEVFLRFSAV